MLIAFFYISFEVLTNVDFEDFSFKVVWYGIIIVGVVRIVDDVDFFVEEVLLFLNFSFLAVDFFEPDDGEDVSGGFTNFRNLGFELIVLFSAHKSSKNDGGTGAYSFNDLTAHSNDVWFISGLIKLVFVIHFEVYFLSFEHVLINFDGEDFEVFDLGFRFGFLFDFLMLEGFGMGKDERTGFGLEGKTEIVGAAVLLQRRNFRVCSVNHCLLNT